MPFNYKTELQRYRRYYQSLEPILKKPKSQSYTAVIFSFLVVSLFGLYAIRPTIQTILSLKREIKDKTDVSQKMEDKIASLIEAQAAYSQVEPSLHLIEEALPTTPEAVPLIIQIRNLGTITGVTLASVQMPTVPLLGQEATAAAKTTKLKKTTDSGKQQSLVFTISVIGPFSAVTDFLQGLQEMRRIVTIRSMAITTDKVTNFSASDSATLTGRPLQLTLDLVSYYLVE